MTRKFLCALLLGGCVLLMCSLPMMAQNSSSSAPTVTHAVSFAVSSPLRELARLPQAPQYGFHEINPLGRIPMKDFGHAVDPVEQSTAGPAANYSIGLNILGVGNGFPNYSVPDAPPDTNMAVGDTQIVQWVNVSYAVFDKTSGKALTGAILGNALFSSLGGNCQTYNSGDIIAQWDVQAHRWLLTQNTFSGSPYYSCVAVSTSPDAMGTYYLYAFSLGTSFPDYPKWGVWPTGYFETVNKFGSIAEVCAFNRTKMLVGDSSAESVCLSPGGGDFSLLPADLDSAVNPPVGEDEFFIGGVNAVDNSHLSLYSMHVDWSNPQGATITGGNNSQLIAVATYTNACNYPSACVPQLGSTTLLDSLGDRLMYRFAYWEDPPLSNVLATPPKPVPAQHWLMNHSVIASGGNSAVRWYEFTAPIKVVPVTKLGVFQQGTYAPDSNWRWMGSIARDKVGDILVGYSISSSSMYPSIGIAGRTVNDSLGTLESEVVVVNGNGAQPDTSNRWGDYSGMRIDQDGCTFWYTTEYYMVTQQFDWSTQIASAKFSNCH
ncbi:MAG: hypothetical protein ACLPND_22735 [Candidatus Korobacteraceae bacterium]